MTSRKVSLLLSVFFANKRIADGTSEVEQFRYNFCCGLLQNTETCSTTTSELRLNEMTRIS